MNNITTIIVTFNGIQWIESCIDSVLSGSVKTNVIVVDNRSTDGTPALIKTRFPEVVLIENEQNRGFGHANNIGIQIAIDQGAGYVFLLNQDARVFNNTIEMLVTGFENFQRVGIISPVHLDGSGKNFDELFFQYLSKSELRPFLLERLLSEERQKQFIHTRFVNAAAWLISVKCLKDIGLFDPLFFHYGEDRNLCHRAVFRGYGILIASHSFICHDRDARIRQSNLTSKTKAKKELTGFLVDAANIRRSNIHWFILKRTIRYSLLTVFTLVTFQFGKALFNSTMTFGIIKNWIPILNSRRRSLKGFRQFVLDRQVTGSVDWA